MFLDVIDNSLGKTITDILATQEINQPFPVIHIGICYLCGRMESELSSPCTVPMTDSIIAHKLEHPNLGDVLSEMFNADKILMEVAVIHIKVALNELAQEGEQKEGTVKPCLIAIDKNAYVVLFDRKLEHALAQHPMGANYHNAISDVIATMPSFILDEVDCLNCTFNPTGKEQCFGDNKKQVLLLMTNDVFDTKSPLKSVCNQLFTL